VIFQHARAAVRFGRLPDLPADEWLRAAERERERSGAQVERRCLTEGLVMPRILTPELCPDEVFHAAFGALAKR
jgi:hypothetical protein